MAFVFSYLANCTKSNLFLNNQIENRKHMNSSKVLNKFNLFNQKNNDLSLKEKALQLDATHKYQRFKKSASLQPYYLSQARLKKITEIYRSLSSDKLKLGRESKSRRNSQLHTPQKKPMLTNNAIGYVNINSFLETTAKGKQKLTIKRERQNQAPTSLVYHEKEDNSVQIMTKIKVLSSKIEDIMKHKLEEKFTTEMNKFCETFKSITEKTTPKDSKEQIIYLLKLFEQCCSRRQTIKTAEIRREYLKFEEEFSNMQVDLKKKAIRAMLDQKDIEKYQARLKQSQTQVKELQNKINSKKIDAAINTQSINCLDQTVNLDAQNIFLPTQFIKPSANPAMNIHEIQRVEDTQNQKIDELKKKVQAYAQRHRELLSVILVLAHEGLDVQKIYSEVISGRITVSEDEAQRLEHCTTKIRKLQNDIYRRCKKIKVNNSIDADDSIISDADGLSFNYDGKSIEEQVYTVRNEYKCRQQLPKQLKNKLKLNFDDFYQQMFDDQQNQQSINPPTI